MEAEKNWEIVHEEQWNEHFEVVQSYQWILMQNLQINSCERSRGLLWSLCVCAAYSQMYATNETKLFDSSIALCWGKFCGIFNLFSLHSLHFLGLFASSFPFIFQVLSVPLYTVCATNPLQQHARTLNFAILHRFYPQRIEWIIFEWFPNIIRRAQHQIFDICSCCISVCVSSCVIYYPIDSEIIEGRRMYSIAIVFLLMLLLFFFFFHHHHLSCFYCRRSACFRKTKTKISGFTNADGKYCYVLTYWPPYPWKICCIDSHRHVCKIKFRWIPCRIAFEAPRNAEIDKIRPHHFRCMENHAENCHKSVSVRWENVSGGGGEFNVGKSNKAKGIYLNFV